MDTIPKEKLARELGYGGPMPALEAELRSAGLSRPEKPNIALRKRPAVAGVIAEHFVLVCNRGDCRFEAKGDDRAVVAASSPLFCEICGGSPVAAAIREMREVCRAAGIRRIVVVGGSPMVRTRLERELKGSLEMRLVDGTMARTATHAREDLAWADLVVVWAGTELLHKATMAYPRGHPRIITTTRRSLPALARAVLAFAQKRFDAARPPA